MSLEKLDDTNDGEPEPPDGGWGWVVVFASFMMNFIIWGILCTSGVLYIELLEELKTGKGQTALISSLAFGTSMCVSPVSSVLSNKYGNRSISIVGSLVSSIGFIVSGFAQNIYLLYVALGVIVGAGFGLTYLPFVVCLNQYFLKRRSFAVGLSVCGTGVGTLVWAPLVELLIETYGWRGTTFILGGAAMNLTVMGSLLRPLKMQRLGIKDLNIPKVDSKDLLKFSNQNLNCVNEDRLLNYNSTSESKEGSDISDSASDKLLPPQKQVSLDNVVPVTRESKDTDSGSMRTMNKICMDYFRRAIRYYDFSLLRHFAFLIFLLSNFIIMLGINAPYVYLPDRSYEKGISKTDSALFISVIGVTNAIARVVFGWLADRKCVNRRYLYTASMVICGTVTLLNPLSDNYIYLLCYSIIYGTFIGGFHCLYVIILVDLLGLKKLSNALGIVILVQGIASFVGPPAAGWLYDITGSYDTPFYGIGGVLVVGGLILCFIPLVENIDKTRCDAK